MSVYMCAHGMVGILGKGLQGKHLWGSTWGLQALGVWLRSEETNSPRADAGTSRGLLMAGGWAPGILLLSPTVVGAINPKWHVIDSLFC